MVITMTDSPERLPFPIKPELAENSERRQWCVRKNEQLRSSIISFLAHVISCIHCENDDIKGKGKSFLFISKPKKGSW